MEKNSLPDDFDIVAVRDLFGDGKPQTAAVWISSRLFSIEVLKNKNLSEEEFLWIIQKSKKMGRTISQRKKHKN